MSTALATLEGMVSVTSSERRHSRREPEARLRTGWYGSTPDLRPGVWYRLETTQPPQPSYVWLKTPNGAVAWQREELELRDGAMVPLDTLRY
jgi:hypothetical protein